MRIIDIAEVSMGSEPAPLLPRALRGIWAREPLPGWLRKELRLSEPATIADLGSSVWGSVAELSPRAKHFLLFLLRTRQRSIWDLRCFDRSWPVGLKVDQIAWSTRTRNCLERVGLLEDEQRLMQVTFGELLDVQGMGVLSVLDFSSTLEGAVDMYDLLTAAATRLDGSEADSPLRELAVAADDDWTGMVSRQDPRFADLLPPYPGTLQGCLEEVLSVPDNARSLALIPALIAALPKIRRRAASIDSQHLEESLVEFLELVARAHGNRLSVLAARLGWDGNPPITLEEAGKRLGVTKERVRQLQKAAERRIPIHETYMPSVDRALVILEEAAPLSLMTASKLLSEKGVSCGQFDVMSLLRAAKLFGKDSSLMVSLDLDAGLIVRDATQTALRPCLAQARKLAGRSGLGSLPQLSDCLAASGIETTESELRVILSAAGDIEFLNDDWFCVNSIPLARNRLRNVARRMLSVASPQTVESLRAGARRYYQQKSSGSAGSNRGVDVLLVPPLEVMTLFFASHKEFVVRNGLVYPTSPLDVSSELGGTERVMVEVLRSSPSGLLDRASFAEGCIARGMNENTFSVYTSYSPVIEHLATDVWALRGTSVKPEAIAASLEHTQLKPRMRRVVGYGWTPDGRIWLAGRIPRLGRESLVLGCPAPMQRYLGGQSFRCYPKGAVRDCGTIRVNSEGTIYGFGPVMRRFALDQDDIILAEFDLALGIAEVSIGDDALLEEGA